MTLKLGKKAKRNDIRTLKFKDYVDLAKLPTIPNEFGHEGLIKDWGMLANDMAGCCVWSGACHETMLDNAEAGRAILFTPENTLSDYATTGYDPKTGLNDNGTVTLDALNYRRNTGVIDSVGARHKIAAFVEIEKGNLEELYAAMYLF